MVPTRLVTDALTRTSFIMGLVWRDPNERFAVSTDGFGSEVRGEFAFPSPDASVARDEDHWLQMEASTSIDAGQSPLVSLKLSLPYHDTSREVALLLVNDLNRLGLAPVYFDASRQAIVVQSRIHYTGYHETPVTGVEPIFTSAQREATLNTFVATFGAAHSCVMRWDVRTGRQGAGHLRLV